MHAKHGACASGRLDRLNVGVWIAMPSLCAIITLLALLQCCGMMAGGMPVWWWMSITAGGEWRAAVCCPSCTVAALQLVSAPLQSPCLHKHACLPRRAAAAALPATSFRMVAACYFCCLMAALARGCRRCPACATQEYHHCTAHCRGFKCEVLYDDGDRQQEPLLPGEWRLLEDDEPLAAAEQQARQATGGRRRVAAGGGKAHAKRQQLPAAEIERQLPAEEAGEEPVKKRQRKSRTAGPAAEEGAAQLADQPEAAAQQAEQEQQERQQPAKQARQRGKPAAKEAALLLEPGQDAAALVQSGRGRRKAAEAAQAGVQAALRAEQGGEVTTVTDAPLPPEVLLEQGAFAAVAAAPAVAAEAAGAAVAGAVASAAAPARQSSSQRRRASGAAKSRAAAAPPAQPPAGSAPQQAAGVAVPAAVAGPAAAAAAAGAAGPAAGEALPPCYWFEKRQAPFNQNLPREARKAELRSQYEVRRSTYVLCMAHGPKLICLVQSSLPCSMLPAACAAHQLCRLLAPHTVATPPPCSGTA